MAVTSSNTDVDVVIVGGGAAGIGAARQLARSGLSIHLVEASSRVGGRAWTHEVAGLDLDLGCGWLHSAERNSWSAIATEAGIPLDRSRAAWGTQHRELGFTSHEQAEAWKNFDDWTKRLAATPPLGDCAADALATSEWNAHLRSIVGFISGAPPEQLSAADYVAYDEHSTEENWRTRRGYGALIASSLPAGVVLTLANPVRALSLEPHGVTVTTRAGDLRARAVILTVSTPVLAGDTIRMPAELDPWREAARRLPLGRNEKVFLEIVGDAPFESETHVTGNPRDPRTGSYYIRPFGWPVIEGFLGGDGAAILIDQGAAAAHAFALDQLCDLFGANVRDKLRPLASTSWSRMVRIGGSYSHALPGHAPARASLARSFDGRVFFAGEATSTTDFSTAHGAHDSGVRAAMEATEALSGQTRLSLS